MSQQLPSVRSKIHQLKSLLAQVRLADIALLTKRLNRIEQINDAAKQQQAITSILQAIEYSIALKQQRATQCPKISFPEELPVSQNLTVISEAIRDHQVVIIAGETGSGKTTQIPKICLQLGRGIDGFIGHTQPRRIAARTVANRIAEELNSELGNAVGYKVRFTDQVNEQTYIKLMTDGILLAEMQKDRLLRQYDTLIIDEAHERSLNIDFILGYLKQILPKRPDLKVIITSATIDPQRFSTHFNQAPIIEVSGRTFPVEIRYRALQEYADNDIINGIINAIDELSRLSMGDILIFLNGEREIRDTAYALQKQQYAHTQVLPLFARLTIQEQNRIFATHIGRNIVLATNVAETSLTVPGIKYVIDTGTARISRYSHRTKVQRLPIETISQASANQRSGRCGRVSAGVCIRLYGEDDFAMRAEFTDPEIVRTNLATVILQMLALDLGDIADFPFVQPPDDRHINDGIRLLDELAAITKHKHRLQLTDIGRRLAKFAIDPRLAKMLLTAIELNCVHEVLIIVSALSIQDPRERPMDKQQAADEQHAKFKDSQSDFISLLNIWQFVISQQQQLSNSQFRKLCQKEFLSYIRLREWQDVYSQLKQTLKELNVSQQALKSHLAQSEAELNQQYMLIHQAILSGLLSHIGQLDEQKEFKGARNSKFTIFPGSGLAKKPPKWVMSAELVETSRLFARMVAKIDVAWIEPLAKHLVKVNYSEPHWEKKQGAVMGYEQVQLFGLIIVPKRKVHYRRIDPQLCHELFIRDALVNGDCVLTEAFYLANQTLVGEIEALEQKARRKNFLVDEQRLVDFYQQRIPNSVVCLASFKQWWKKQKLHEPQLLHFTKAYLLNETDEQITASAYPEWWQQGALKLPLSYHFSPGDDDDGISVHIPVGLLNQVQDNGFDWLIPAFRLELIIALIKGLPKSLRKNFVPAPNYAEACLATISPDAGLLIDAVSKKLLQMTGVRLPEGSWQQVILPAHLIMNFKVLDEQGKIVKQGRNLTLLQQQLQGKVTIAIKKVAKPGIERSGIVNWDFAALPNNYQQQTAQITIKAYPALVDKKHSVAIELFEQQHSAEQAMLKGLCRLMLLNIPSPIKYLQEKLPNKAKLGLYFNPFGSINELLQDCVQAACQHLLAELPSLPRDEAAFIIAKDHVRAELADCVLQAAIQIEQILLLHHELRKRLKASGGLALIQSQSDIKQQLNSLVFKGFVTDVGVSHLAHVLRYLQGMNKRLEKLPIDPNQDRLKMLELSKITDLCQQTIQQQSPAWRASEACKKIRWMLQELRVSLFAQQLGTAYPISVKRIKHYLQEVKLG